MWGMASLSTSTVPREMGAQAWLHPHFPPRPLDEDDKVPATLRDAGRGCDGSSGCRWLRSVSPPAGHRSPTLHLDQGRLPQTDTTWPCSLPGLPICSSFSTPGTVLGRYGLPPGPLGSVLKPFLDGCETKGTPLSAA